ncbi:MAG: hypothetical protein IJ188_08330 [Clostridia bacterium]|nr:hypothetical protein [Clostridia bacterium]
MAKKTEITWVHEGFSAILCDKGTMGAVKSATEKIQASANANNRRGGEGFGAGTRIANAFGSKRAMGFVYTTDIKSRIAEAEDKALSRAVGG